MFSGLHVAQSIPEVGRSGQIYILFAFRAVAVQFNAPTGFDIHIRVYPWLNFLP
jgi:hypothetical protein